MPALISPITDGSITNLLNQLVSKSALNDLGSAGSLSDVARNPFVFDSDLRRSIRGQASTQLHAAQQIQSTIAAKSSLDTSKLSQNKVLTAQSNAQTIDLTNQLSSVNAGPVTLLINPSSIEFDQPKRYERQDTMAGTVFHHFTNDKGQNNDILTIRFQGSTGNIYRGGNDDEARQRAVARLKIWHSLYQLTREAILNTNGEQNRQYVTYTSPLFPRVIEFTGFWTHVLRFSETGRKNRSRDYSMEFIVQDTNPSLDEISTLIVDFVSNQTVATPSDTSQNLSSLVIPSQG